MRPRPWLAAALLASSCYRGSATEPAEPMAPPAPGKEPDEAAARAAVKRFLGAVDKHDKVALRAMLETTVDIY